MTEAQVKKRARAAWSPAARAKRKATIARKKREAKKTPVINLASESGLLNESARTALRDPEPRAEQIAGLQHPDVSFTAEQVMALLRELWRKGP